MLVFSLYYVIHSKYLLVYFCLTTNINFPKYLMVNLTYRNIQISTIVSKVLKETFSKDS